MFLRDPIPTLNTQQLYQYFDHIGLCVVNRKLVPKTEQTSLHSNGNAVPVEGPLPPKFVQPTLETLTILMRAHVSHITFGNIGILYFDRELPNTYESSRNGQSQPIERHPPMIDLRVNLNLTDLFYKMVERNLGGFCFEHNTLFAAVLRGLKFDPLWTGCGRVTTDVKGSRENYNVYGYCHMTIFWIDAEGTQYLIDVGFGGSGPSAPIPMRLNEEFRVGITNESFKLTLEPLPKEQTRRPKATPASGGRSDQGFAWALNYTREGLGDWLRLYLFTDEELYHADYTKLATAIYCTPGPTLFNSNVIATKQINDSRGRISLINDKFKITQEGEIIVQRRLTTEAERIDILREYFNIRLSSKEIEANKWLSLDGERECNTQDLGVLES
ncbi:uncharacterized protein VTP21DRAFT_7958 [Calcarisporiella thermophila]|uniref:uncharacterized protein n=1 Tax=Calcarisporiella thermophila TaxID=911321 RepID=UPI003744221F